MILKIAWERFYFIILNIKLSVNGSVSRRDMSIRQIRCFTHYDLIEDYLRIYGNPLSEHIIIDWRIHTTYSPHLISSLILDFLSSNTSFNLAKRGVWITLMGADVTQKQTNITCRKIIRLALVWIIKLNRLSYHSTANRAQKKSFIYLVMIIIKEQCFNSELKFNEGRSFLETLDCLLLLAMRSKETNGRLAWED